MTLHRQLTITLSLLFVAMFLGTWLTNVEGTRSFLAAQLSSHAQDTATSLGLSLSPHLAANDQAAASSMVNAIFDPGYYRQIVVTASDGKHMIDRQQTVKVDGVPSWFIQLLPLETPERSAMVMAGWKQVATVAVRSHPGFAYRELWSNTLVMLVWFLALTLLSILATSLALRLLLKPLRAVEQQAEDICQRRYTTQSSLPRTRELRSVVEAMNRMTLKVQAMFTSQADTAERLRGLAFADSLTGLGNRRYFEAQANAQLQSESVAHGALFLIRLHGLQQLNEAAGFDAGDRLLQAVGQVLKARVDGHDDCLAARLSGGDFVLQAGHLDATQTDEWAQSLTNRLAQLYADNLAPASEVLHLGSTLFAQGDNFSELLAQADTALRSAQCNGPNSWSRYQAGTDQPATTLGRQAWVTTLRAAIDAGTFQLHVQRAIPLAKPDTAHHHEVLVRLPDEHGILHSANKFMPVATQLGLAVAIDRVIMERLVTQLGTHRGPSAPLAINLSPATLRDPTASAHILQIASRSPCPLLFEISEFVAVRELASLREFASQALAMGHGVAIDHFGRAFSPFGYLQSLRPSYVKIDGTFTGGLEQDQDRQFYIRTLCNVAHSLDIQVVAASVEHTKLFPLLASLGVDGAQGYATGDIVPFTLLS